MPIFTLGRTEFLQASFTDGATPPNPSDPPSVVFTITDPLGGITTATWTGPGAGSFSGAGAAFMSRPGVGVFQYAAVPAIVSFGSPGGLPYRWTFVSSGTTQPAEVAGAFHVIANTAYPFPFGYCDISDVQSRINAGSWNPYQTGAMPSASQVNQYVADGAVLIDQGLAAAGYYVPLRAQIGLTIDARVYLMLANANACYATGMTEQARHGSVDESEDHNGALWLTFFDDLMTRLEQGDDNLSLFGCDGPFMPVADKSLGMSAGGQHDILGGPTTPFFTRDMWPVTTGRVGAGSDDWPGETPLPAPPPGQ